MPNRPRTRVKRQPRYYDPGPSPINIRKAHPMAWREALILADGNARRLWVDYDGSVTVFNREVR